eukprot:3288646-Rhodomonas_salina.1
MCVRERGVCEGERCIFSFFFLFVVVVGGGGGGGVVDVRLDVASCVVESWRFASLWVCLLCVCVHTLCAAVRYSVCVVPERRSSLSRRYRTVGVWPYARCCTERSSLGDATHTGVQAAMETGARGALEVVSSLATLRTLPFFSSIADTVCSTEILCAVLSVCVQC